MNRKPSRRGKTLPLLAMLLSASMAGVAQAAPVTFDFESLADGQALTAQLAGVGLSFSHATALKAGFSLNELDFPPRSGDVVVSDDGAALSVDFSSPVFGVGGYFTYATGLTFSVYDAASQLLAVVASGAASNLATGGGAPPNEFLGHADAAGRISRIVVEGEPTGFSFVVDDLTVDFGAQQVPEPQSLALLLTALGAGCLPGGWLRRRTGGRTVRA